MNDKSKIDIKFAQDNFGNSKWDFDSIDCINISAEKLVKKWNLKEKWDENSLIFTNPPFGLVRSTKSKCSYKGGKSGLKTKCKFHESLKKYHGGDDSTTAIGQLIEIIKKLHEDPGCLKEGYLAFFSPAGLFFGRNRMRNLLKEILTNFTFLEGCILSGKDFNNVNKDKPIAFTIWKFGGKTKHLDLEFECNGRIIKLDTSQRNFDLLKNGWRYKEKSTQNTLYVGARDCSNEPCLPTFTSISSGTGARVIRQNVKKKISFDNSFDKFPSELIYALWSIIFGNKRITPPIVVPLAFNEAYTHIPKDFNNSNSQKILLCSSLWVFIKEIGTLVEGKINIGILMGRLDLHLVIPHIVLNLAINP